MGNVDPLLGETDSGRGHVGNSLRKLHETLIKFFRCNHIINEIDAECLLRVNFITGKDNALCGAQSHELGKTCCSALVRGKPEAYFRHRDTRVISGYSHIAADDQLGTCPVAEAFDSRDNGH